MSEFTWRPTFGANLTKKPRVTKTQFGDGYVQRTRNGINTSPEEWDNSFDGLDPDTGAAIMDFLDARGGVDPFDWRNHRGELKRYTCEDYSQSFAENGTVSIKAKFVQFYG